MINEFCSKIQVSDAVSQEILIVLRDCTITRGLKNTPPSAAVENIGQ